MQKFIPCKIHIQNPSCFVFCFCSNEIRFSDAFLLATSKQIQFSPAEARLGQTRFSSAQRRLIWGKLDSVLPRGGSFGVNSVQFSLAEAHLGQTRLSSAQRRLGWGKLGSVLPSGGSFGANSVQFCPAEAHLGWAKAVCCCHTLKKGSMSCCFVNFVRKPNPER